MKTIAGTHITHELISCVKQSSNSCEDNSNKAAYWIRRSTMLWYRIFLAECYLAVTSKSNSKISSAKRTMPLNFLAGPPFRYSEGSHDLELGAKVLVTVFTRSRRGGSFGQNAAFSCAESDCCAWLRVGLVVLGDWKRSERPNCATVIPATMRTASSRTHLKRDNIVECKRHQHNRCFSGISGRSWRDVDVPCFADRDGMMF